jgi:hypothetical protein
MDEDTVESLMKKVDKNPIALLNEFCTRAKFKIDYLTTVKKIKSRQTFFCQVAIDGNKICGGYQGKNSANYRGRMQTGG